MDIKNLLNSNIDTSLVNDDLLLSDLESILISAGVDGDPKKGTSGSDTYDLSEESNGEKINAGGGSDLILGSSGDDRLSGNGDYDVVIGNAGNDVLKGDGGNDVLKGDAGSDDVRGQGGDDHLIYQLLDNVNDELNTSDNYDGGVGTDTLWLALTNGEYNEYQQIIADMKAFVEANRDATVDNGVSQTFEFVDPITGTVSSLTFEDIEKIEVLITNRETAIIGETSGNVTEDDDTDNDGLLEANGTLTISDADHLDERFIPDATLQIGEYGGKFQVINQAGNWTYQIDNTQNHIQQLAEGETVFETFTVKSIDGTEETFKITITGTNDQPVVSDLAIDAVEDSATVNGSFVVSDIDSIDTHTFAITSQPSEGSVVNNNDGTFTFDPGADFQDLAEGETHQVTFTYTATDDSGAANATSIEKTVTVTVTGTNDAPIATFTTAQAVNEDGAAITGQLTSTDVDNNATATYALEGDAIAGLTLNSDASWSFNPSDDAYQSLAEGEQQVITVNYSVTDDQGAVDTESFIITVTGTNDGAKISGNTTGTVTEKDNQDEDGFLEVSGTLTVTDVDNDEAFFNAVTLTGTYGSLVIDANGNWSYSADNNQTAIQSLNSGESLKDTFTVNSVDGTEQTVTVTINGVNDAVLYFSANDGVKGTELYKVDSSGKVTLVADIYSGSGSSDAGAYGGFVEFNNALYFNALDADNGSELRKLDNSGTITTFDIGLGSSDAGVYGGFVEFNNALYFTARDTVNGYELRQLDSSGNITTFDINSIPGFSSVAGSEGGFVEFNNALYFNARDSDGYELRKLDNSGTITTFDIYSGSRSSFAGLDGGFVEFNNALYFNALDADNGSELRKLDSSGNVTLVEDIYSGSDSSRAGLDGGFVEFNNALYFTARDADNGSELRKLDSSGNVTLVEDIYSGSGWSRAGQIGGFVEFNNALYFTARDTVNGYELRQLDSSGNVTTLDIYSGSGSSAAGIGGGFVEFNNALYFSARSSVNGYELHKLDSSGNVTLVKDINSGRGSSDAGAYGGFVEFNNALYFTARDTVNGYELRKLDSSGNVTLVKDIYSGSGSSVANLFGGSGLTTTAIDPLVLDLNNDGITLLSAPESQVEFDATQDGIPELIGWFGAEDGLLVSDVNGDGLINDFSEVVSPIMVEGTTSSFTALATFDSNNDNLIDGIEADTLQIWRDSNSDGITDDGELLSLADLGVESISLTSEAVEPIGFGNQVLSLGEFTYSDGTMGKILETEFASTPGSNTVYGSQSADTLIGTHGDEYLIAFGGNDILNGGAGNDAFIGGTGADQFVFASDSGNDIIEDFTVEEDMLVLEEGLSISGITENTYNSTGFEQTTTLVTFNTGDTVTLYGVSDVTDPNTLIA